MTHFKTKLKKVLINNSLKNINKNYFFYFNSYIENKKFK